MKIIKVICYANGFFESVEILPTMAAVQAFIEEKSAFDVKRLNDKIKSFSYRDEDILFECYIEESSLDIGLQIVVKDDEFVDVESKYCLEFAVVTEDRQVMLHKGLTLPCG